MTTGKDNPSMSGTTASLRDGFGWRLGRLFGVGESAPEEPKLVTPNPETIPEPAPVPRQGYVDAQNIENLMLLAALDALHTPVILIEERMTVLHANDEARHVFGEKMQGRSLGLFFRNPKAIGEIEKTIADGQSRNINVDMDVPIQRQYKLQISKMGGQRTQNRIVLEFQETTFIRRSETMRSDFVANVSHELRSPLATIIGFIETLKEDGAEEETRGRFLDIMDGEAQRMRRLIDDLLSLTKVELHEHERPRLRVPICDVLKEVMDSLAPRARAIGVELCLDCQDNLPAVLGESDQLVQVFHNLMTNAMKYGADGRFVEISAQAHSNGLPDGGPSIEVIVRDYGQGVEPEHLPRLTERFYRVDKGRSRVMGGTGLGLAIVKHIVNRHRGRFQMESQVSKGTVCKVRLPVYREESIAGDTNL